MATALIWVLFGYHHVGYFRCNTCGTRMVRHEWGLGEPNGFGFRVMPIAETLTGSRAQREILEPGHRHEWSGWFGWVPSTFCALHWDGHPRYNSFGESYEDDPEFGSFIREKLRTGPLTRETVASLIALRRPPRPPGFCPAHPPKEPPPPFVPDPEHTALVQLGERLFTEYHGAPSADAWWYWR